MIDKHHWLKVLQSVFLLLILWLGLASLDSVPPPWWDEGWTLNVARNWVELGHYGQLQAGKPASPGLSASLLVVAPVALSFRLLGIGIWQGRLPGVLFTFGAIALLCYLAKRLYSRGVMWATLFVLIFLPGVGPLHSLLVGRQVLGEMPALFYLLAGFASLFLALKKTPPWALLTILFWGFALRTKLQVAPFWLVSLLLGLCIAYFKKWLRHFWVLLGALVGSAAVYAILGFIEPAIIGEAASRTSAVKGLFGVTALVFVPQARLLALLVALRYGLPLLIATCLQGVKISRNLHQIDTDPEIEILRITLLGFIASWFIWYAFLAMYWLRYLFPAIFLGSIFVSALLQDLTDGFNLRLTVHRASALLLKWRWSRQAFNAVLAILLIAITIPFTLMDLWRVYRSQPDSTVVLVTDYLNQNTQPDALIESYDSELFFLLDRPYHYPPDEVHVLLNQRTALEMPLEIDYNPLESDPDYLVIGSFGKMWGLYDAVIEAGDFQLIQTISKYNIYKRRRP
jgi:4-amino-4-deoxy-L-arabinose transferase-like glycosyltransferase